MIKPKGKLIEYDFSAEQDLDYETKSYVWSIRVIDYHRISYLKWLSIKIAESRLNVAIVRCICQTFRKCNSKN